jgi:hypothetical protein
VRLRESTEFPTEVKEVLAMFALWTGTWRKTAKPPRFTKSGQEPNGMKLVESHVFIDS